MGSLDEQKMALTSIYSLWYLLEMKLFQIRIIKNTTESRVLNLCVHSSLQVFFLPTESILPTPHVYHYFDSILAITIQTISFFHKPVLYHRIILSTNFQRHSWWETRRVRARKATTQANMGNMAKRNPQGMLLQLEECIRATINNNLLSMDKQY